jgi:hypothetical protein
VAEEARFLWRLREDMVKTIVRLRHWAHHYGEFASDCVSFTQMLKYREREMRQIEKRIEEVSHACPLFFDAFKTQNLTPVFWAFFVGEFRRMRTVGGVHCHIGRSRGFRYPQGKALLRFKSSFFFSRREPFWSLAESIRVKMVGRGYTEVHARNAAWSRLFHELLESLYFKMRRSCESCIHRREEEGDVAGKTSGQTCSRDPSYPTAKTPTRARQSECM